MAKKKSTSTIARELGRRGGQRNTPKQQAARRKNAKRAGRPRRVCVICDQPVKGGHVDTKRDRTCGAHGWRWQQRNKRVDVAVVLDEIESLVRVASYSLPLDNRASLLVAMPAVRRAFKV